MAGPYTDYAKFTNGRILQIYMAANVAVGTYVPIELNGAVASTSPTDFRVPEAMTLYDVIATGATGMVQVIADGTPTNRFIPLDASAAATVANRNIAPLTFRPGVKYQFQVCIQGAA